MKNFWLTFTDGTKGFCNGETPFDAKKIAEKMTGKKVAGGQYRDIAAEPIPYPAAPIIWQFDHPVYGKCPPFCTTPQKCVGRTSCPHSYACSE